MIPPPRNALPRALVLALGASLCLGLGRTTAAEADRPLPRAFTKLVPETLRDLQQIQTQVSDVVERVMATTVGLRIGQAQGSGVLIEGGYVLTAGHVSGEPGRKVEILLHDGSRLRGVTLGANVGIDSGLIRIEGKGDYPFAEMARNEDLRKGQWCVALGHPGGYQPGRAPVVRLGRILEVREGYLRTDCALVGGDSGGPLFDMNGRVIGIHSRIGTSMNYNMHVPIETYKETWDRLAASEVWGDDFALLDTSRPGGAYLGIETDPEARPIRILAVTPDSPAARAGLRVDDIIVSIGRRHVTSLQDLRSLLRDRPPGSELTLHVRRGDETVSLSVTLGRRPS